MMPDALMKLHSWLIDRRAYRWVKALVRGPEVSQQKIASFLDRVRGARLPKRDQEVTSLALIVPCFNHAAYLERMFHSIASQSRMPDQVIFVDDCSPDATGETLEKLAAALPGRCSILRNPANLGQAASLNRGIEAATTDLLMVLNDDDYLFPDAVDLMLALFNRHRDLFMIGGTSVHFESDEALEAKLREHSSRDASRMPLRRYDPQQVRSYRYYNDLNMTNSGCCFLKTAWQAAGAYYPDKSRRVVPFSDRDFQLRVNALFPVGVSTSEAISFWRNNSSVDCGVNS